MNSHPLHSLFEHRGLYAPDSFLGTSEDIRCTDCIGVACVVTGYTTKRLSPSVFPCDHLSFRYNGMAHTKKRFQSPVAKRHVHDCRCEPNVTGYVAVLRSNPINRRPKRHRVAGGVFRTAVTHHRQSRHCTQPGLLNPQVVNVGRCYREWHARLFRSHFSSRNTMAQLPLRCLIRCVLILSSACFANCVATVFSIAVYVKLVDLERLATFTASLKLRCVANLIAFPIRDSFSAFMFLSALFAFRSFTAFVSRTCSECTKWQFATTQGTLFCVHSRYSTLRLSTVQGVFQKPRADRP